MLRVTKGRSAGDGKPHEPGADAFALRCLVNGERPEQEGRDVARLDVPQADGADEAAPCIAGDQRQATRRLATAPQPLGWLEQTLATHDAVEQGVTGLGFGGVFGIEVDHLRSFVAPAERPEPMSA